MISRRTGLRIAMTAFGMLGAALVWANIPPGRLPDNVRADRLILDKSVRRLSAYGEGRLIRTYRVSLGRQPVGQKLRQGDNKTPEGRYTIDSRNPRSRFHLSLHISYPNPADVARAHTSDYPPGSDIMIHGLLNGLGWIGRLHLCCDWTAGCAAVTNPEIEELWRIVPEGTPIEIRP